MRVLVISLYTKTVLPPKPYIPSTSYPHLTSTKTIRKIIGLTDLAPYDNVLEIGPGKGHLTAVLLEHCTRVTAIELDQRLYIKLKKFTNAPNLHLSVATSSNGSCQRQSPTR